MIKKLRGLFAPPPSAVPTSEKVKDPAYAEKYGMSVADWMIYHQDEVHFEKMRWMGIPILKNPLDLWIYQEILWDVKPEIFIEIGSLSGGSTAFFCHLFDILGQGEVLSLDIDRSTFQVEHPRLTCLTGDCSSPEIVEEVHRLARGKKTLVLHDGDHRKDPVLRDLRLYADLVTVGSYLIVEDGVVDVFDRRHSKLGWDKPGPLAAAREFLEEDDRFEIDQERERYLITYSPGGFLRRVK